MHPEQQRALAFLARRGTAAAVAALRSELAEAARSIEERFAAVPVAVRAKSPAPGKWSPVEILDHLVRSHEPAIDQLRALLAGREPGGVAIPAGLSTPAAERASWDELAARLAATHGALLALVDGASAESSLAPKAVVEMVVKIPDAAGVPAPVHWFERLDWKAFVQAIRAHTLEHRTQLESTLAKVAEPAD